MVTKTYETESYILKYDVDGRKRTFTFEDHRGVEVTLNHLVFYDWEVVHKITEGSMLRHDVIRWVIENMDKIRPFLEENFDNYTLFTEFRLGDEELALAAQFNCKVPIFSGGIPSAAYCLVPYSSQKALYSVAGLGYAGSIRVDSTNFNNEGVQKFWNKLYNYSFKMNPTEFNFFRKTKKDGPYSPMFGVELEVCTKLSPEEITRIVTDVEPRQEPFFIFKRDVSITGQYDHKLELVTVPCTYNYQRKAWKTFFGKVQRLAQYKGKSVSDYFDTSPFLNNGLHVHVSRESFVSTFHERKFLTLYNQINKRSVDFLTALSGRPSSFKDNRFCKVGHEYDGRTLARRLKVRTPDDRQTVCHGLNSATVEVRLYQGIFDVTHLLRCLELTAAMLDFSNECSFTAISQHFKLSFTKYLKKTTGYRNVKEFLKCA